MLQIQQALAIVATILNVVAAVGGTSFTAVEPIIGKVQIVLSGLTALTPPNSLNADIQDLSTSLNALQSSGIVPAGSPANAALTTALGILGKFNATVADYKSGQAAVIDDNFSFEGVPGVLIAVSKGGPAAQALGM